MKVRAIRKLGWFWYITDNAKQLDAHKCGKWMHFFSNQAFAQEICQKAIDEGVCWECKCTDLETTGHPTGVICFYLNCDDFEHHRSVIVFMIQNDLIRKTKTGNLYNISFKLDDQTRAGEYGTDYEGAIRLSEFVDLKSGKWIHN